MTDYIAKWFTPEELAHLQPLLKKATVQGWHHWIRTRSDYAAILEGCYFDEAAAQRFVTFASKFVVQVNGRFKGKPFKVLPWQYDFVVGPLFGWKRADGLRRFRKAFVTVPKKNGKSALAAVIQIYMLVADGENGANCYCAPWTKKQAALVWGEAAKYVAASPKLKARLRIFKGSYTVTFEETASKLTVLSADKFNAEGIDAHCVVLDELHMARSSILYEILRYAGDARANRLVPFIITTAGGIATKENVCYVEYDYAKRVLSGEIVDVECLACVFEAPADADPADPAVWRLANPSLGVTIDEKDVATAYKEAIEKNQLPNFRRRRLNQWVEDEKHWLDKAKWEACRGEFPENLAELPCWFGIDVSAKQDITALVKVWKDENRRLYVKARFWLPEDTYHQRLLEGRSFYQNWVDKGWLEITPGATINTHELEPMIAADAEAVALQSVAADPWNALDLLGALDSEGYPVAEVRQTTAFLSFPMKELEGAILSRSIVHDGNEVLTWMIGNCCPFRDSNGNMRPDKKRSADKIDGISALVTAMNRVLASQDEQSAYDLPEEQRVVFI